MLRFDGFLARGRPVELSSNQWVALVSSFLLVQVQTEYLSSARSLVSFPILASSKSDQCLPRIAMIQQSHLRRRARNDGRHFAGSLSLSASRQVSEGNAHRSFERSAERSIELVSQQQRELRYRLKSASVVLLGQQRKGGRICAIRSIFWKKPQT